MCVRTCMLLGIEPRGFEPSSSWGLSFLLRQHLAKLSGLAQTCEPLASASQSAGIRHTPACPAYISFLAPLHLGKKFKVRHNGYQKVSECFLFFRPIRCISSVSWVMIGLIFQLSWVLISCFRWYWSKCQRVKWQPVSQLSRKWQGRVYTRVVTSTSCLKLGPSWPLLPFYFWAFSAQFSVQVINTGMREAFSNEHLS